MYLFICKTNARYFELLIDVSHKEVSAMFNDPQTQFWKVSRALFERDSKEPRLVIDKRACDNKVLALFALGNGWAISEISRLVSAVIRVT